MTPPGGTAVAVELRSNKVLLNGLPRALADVSDQTAGLGVWTLELRYEDVAKLPPSLHSAVGDGKTYRLNAAAVADLAIASTIP